jgi:hypothetical protein
LIGHRLLHGPDRIAAAESQVRQCIGRGQGELFGRHIDQTGIGHGLPGTGDERPRQLFTAKQAQDEVDKRVHRRFPSIEIESVELFADARRLPSTLWISARPEIGA